MSERLGAVGGSLELRPAGPPGFRLIATVPATPRADAAADADRTDPAAGGDGRRATARTGATVTE
jgi:hypothetical protein